MAVIYYGEGTHDAGFVGFRVARTVGVADDYRQEYFSWRVFLRNSSPAGLQLGPKVGS